MALSQQVARPGSAGPSAVRNPYSRLPNWLYPAFVFVALLVALSFIDLDHFWLPEQLSLPLLVLGLLSPLWNPDLGATLAAFNLVPGPPLLQAFASSWGGALLGAGVLWSVGLLGKVVFKKEAMGLGDVVLLAGIGAWLGVQALFFVVMFASMQGALIGVVMILRRPKEEPAAPAVIDNQSVNETQPPAEGEEEWKPDPHHVPFGPFLALAAVEQLLAGDAIWSGWMGVMNHLWDWLDKLLGRA